ncbi:MAG: dihydrolipoamide acetyltransferase family protein [Candidatus Eiseniibacteriota bacterium]
MATEVVMPQMGESLAEGTVTKWLKKVGDRIERDEPLFEISTDKVDSVIPAPAAGYLTEIRVPEGTTVDINTVVGVIDASPAGAGTGAAPEPPAAAPSAAPAQAPAPADTLPRDTSPLGLNVKPIVVPLSILPTGTTPPGPAAPAGQPTSPRVAAAAAAASAALGATAAPGGGSAGAAPAGAGSSGARGGGNGAATTLVHPTSGRVLTSPLVKRIAKEEQVDLRAIPGTGMGGRVTRTDVTRYIEARKSGAAAAGVGASATGAAAGVAAFGLPAPSPSWLPQVMPGDRVEPMPRMRELIAQHMVFSKHTSPHVYTVFEFDLTRIAAIRAREKAAFEQQAGVKLTFLPFIVRATVHALRKNPILNSSVRGNEIVYHASANIGIAVDLNPGLIVPVVKQAEEKSFLGLARSIVDLADRARKKQLSPDDVQHGTFTITNPGVFGSLFGCPVINQPQVAILDVGGIVKRPVVVSDEDGDKIAIRSICLMSVAFDHRVVDGASADHFMNDVRDFLEGWSEPLY